MSEIGKFIATATIMTLAVAIIFSLAGCSSGPRLHVDDPRPVEVRVAVPVPCVARAQIPAMPPQVGQSLDGDAAHDSAVLGASALHLRSALDKALALLTGCVGE